MFSDVQVVNQHLSIVILIGLFPVREVRKKHLTEVCTAASVGTSGITQQCIK